MEHLWCSGWPAADSHELKPPLEPSLEPPRSPEAAGATQESPTVHLVITDPLLQGAEQEHCGTQTASTAIHGTAQHVDNGTSGLCHVSVFDHRKLTEVEVVREWLEMLIGQA